MANAPTGGSGADQEAAIQQMIAAAIGSGGGGNSKKPSIYMGKGFNMFGGPAPVPGPSIIKGLPQNALERGTPTVQTMGYDQAQALPATWSSDEMRSFVNKGILNEHQQTLSSSSN